MAEEFNLEESSAYFASDKLKDFVRQQSAFDRLMMSRSALPIATFDFLIGFAIFMALQAAVGETSTLTAVFFLATFCASGFTLGLFSMRFRFDRWQSLLLSLKSWILAYAFTLGFAPLWAGESSTGFAAITIGSLGASLVMYIAHWYLARGLRHHAFHFVMMGDPTPTTISLLKEVRRPREVVSYRHIHKLYHLMASHKSSDASQVIQTLLQNDISTIVLTSDHAPTFAEEILLIEASKVGINCLSEEDLWEDITKSAMVSQSRRNDFLRAVQVDGRPVQAMFRKALDAMVASIVMIALAPLFLLLYIVASLRIGSHALAEQKFLGLGRTPFSGSVLRFNAHNPSTLKELKVGQHAQNSLFERWCWKSGMWKYPLLWQVVKGRLSLVGSPLRSPNGETAAEKENALVEVLHRTMPPGLISHFELVEQEPTYFESPQRQPLHYSLYYRKHRSLLLDTYMIALCLLNKAVGR